MEDKTLYRIAIIVSTIGIVGLFLVSSKITVAESTIDQIDEINDEVVKLTGRVNSVRVTEKTTRIQLTQPKTVEILLFKRLDGTEQMQGKTYTIYGRIDKEEGSTKIIADWVEEVG